MFINTPNKGNPAGIVFNGDDFSAEEMQKIAYQA
ncbi:PhzF family phenazine biosynthesis protein, partial [Priestia megaterium]